MMTKGEVEKNPSTLLLLAKLWKIINLLTSRTIQIGKEANSSCRLIVMTNSRVIKKNLQTKIIRFRILKT